MSTSKPHKRLRRILQSDPTICLIRTPSGLYRTHHHWFSQLCGLPWLVRLAPRIARVADGFAVIISGKELYVYRTDRLKVDPSLPTFSQLIERAWVFKCESRSLSPDERQEAATRNYALYCVLEAV